MGNYNTTCTDVMWCLKDENLQKEHIFQNKTSPGNAVFEKHALETDPKAIYPSQDTSSISRDINNKNQVSNYDLMEFRKKSINLINSTKGSTNKIKLPEVLLENGSTYTGEWVNGLRQGEGKLLYTDGSIYEGKWLNDKAHGEGCFKNSKGHVYQGQFADDKANGYAVFSSANGFKYEGYWKDDQYHGKGKEI